MINIIKKLFGIHIHTWGSWTDFKDPWKRWISDANMFVSFNKTGQRRYCVSCGQKQERYDV